MTDKKTKRDRPISYKPPKHRRAEFEQMVDDSGLPTNAFINECVFGRSRHRPGEVKFLARILGTCGEIATALKRFSGSSNEQIIALLCEIRDELIKIRSLLMQALGRRS